MRNKLCALVVLAIYLVTGNVRAAFPGVYEPNFRTLGGFTSISGASLAIAPGGGLVSAVSGTSANASILLPQINDATKPWRANVRIVYAGDAATHTIVNFSNPNDTSWGVFSMGINAGQTYVSIGGSTQISSADGCVIGQTYDLFVASDGNQVCSGSIPLGHAGVEVATGFSSHAANESYNTYPITYQNSGHTAPYQKTGTIAINQSSASNVIKGIMFTQGSLVCGPDTRFQPPCLCPFQVTRADTTVDTTGMLFVPDGYTGGAYDAVLVGHPNNSTEGIGFSRNDPDAGAAFAFLRSKGLAEILIRGDAGSYSNAYASPWGAPNGVAVRKQALDQVAALAPGMRNLHLIGQSMAGFDLLGLVTQYPGVAKSFIGISASLSLTDCYNGSHSGANSASTINGAYPTYYVSLQAANTGNAVSNGTWWSQVTPPGGILQAPYATYTNRGAYAGGTTYAANDVVYVNATALAQIADHDPTLRPGCLTALPILLYHASGDTTVPILDTTDFTTAFSAAGGNATLVTISGGGHLTPGTLWNGPAFYSFIASHNTTVGTNGIVIGN